jgi:two-component system sensor histidine kinase KdpD
VLAAVAASLLLNWYFTAPIHTFTIAQPRELLALLLFVTVAVAVSSVVHLAARRAVQAARAREEAAALLELAQTVLGGADSPAAVLEHLTGPTAARPNCRSGWPGGGSGPRPAGWTVPCRRRSGSTSVRI